MGTEKLLGLVKGKKFDEGKEPIHLIPVESLFEIAKVLEFGKQKYGEHNWKNGIQNSRLYSATMRHMMKWMKGEDIDPESNLPHLAHAGTNILMLIWNVSNKPEMDDRYISEKGE